MPEDRISVRHFLDLGERTAAQAMLQEAARRKAGRVGLPKGLADADAPLLGHVLALIFEKASTRTRVSFDMAMRQLGGASQTFAAGDMQLGRGESVADTARVLSRLVDGVMLRTGPHAKLVELADHATIPVINGLSDFNHPCQALADVLTVQEALGGVAGTVWAWVGDGNNVAHSLIEAASLFDFTLRLATPATLRPDGAVVARAQALGARIELADDPRAVVDQADVVVTDTWVSMGEEGAAAKHALLAPYQVTPNLMAQARSSAIFLHCLPAHRGEEVTASVIDGPQSRVWEEAENRLHAQKAILLWAFGMLSS